MHGIGGAEPEALVGSKPKPEEAIGVESGFFGGTAAGMRASAYIWGGLSSGRAYTQLAARSRAKRRLWRFLGLGGPVRIFWIILLPFTLLNLASHMQLPGGNRRRANGGPAGMGALALTSTFISYFGILSIVISLPSAVPKLQIADLDRLQWITPRADGPSLIPALVGVVLMTVAVLSSRSVERGTRKHAARTWPENTYDLQRHRRFQTHINGIIGMTGSIAFAPLIMSRSIDVEMPQALGSWLLTTIVPYFVLAYFALAVAIYIVCLMVLAFQVALRRPGGPTVGCAVVSGLALVVQLAILVGLDAAAAPLRAEGSGSVVEMAIPGIAGAMLGMIIVAITVALLGFRRSFNIDAVRREYGALPDDEVPHGLLQRVARARVFAQAAPRVLLPICCGALVGFPLFGAAIIGFAPAPAQKKWLARRF